ncbi:MAG: tol-pal system YbgF family protein, partial [Phycisphaerae bacterium]
HDFPSVASWNTWRKLQANSPDSLLGAAALLRLAQLEAREGDVERAARKLTLLVRRFDARLDKRDTEFPATVQARGVMTRGAPEGSLGIPLERILLEAHRLRDLIAHNRDPLYGYDPLSGTQRRDDEVRFGLLDLNPRHKRYVANLAALRAHYPRCQLEDNIDLEIAKATPDAPARIRRLRTLLAAFPRGDAAPEALFRLALVTRTHRDSQAGREAFARLFRDFPDSIWARQASRYVEWTPSSVAVGTRP